jgi:Protein of unknown function (DUF3800)
MTKTYNVYCDESCHLEHDHIPVMVLGAVWCEAEASRELGLHLRGVKQAHGLSPDFETKWTKVSPAKIGFYCDLVDLFFDEPRLHFRSVVIPDKEKLNHEAFGQDHDTWYYKMWFVLLKQVLDPEARYHIYLDIKDSRSQQKVQKLHDVLCNNLYDFNKGIIERVQQVRSHEVELLQLADLWIGAIAYLNRGLSSSKAKQVVIDRLRERSGLSLSHTTLPREEKVNLLVWNAREW